MRAVRVGALVLALVGSSGLGRGDPPSLPRESSCEEECRSQRARDDAACDDAVREESARGSCHQVVQARLDVCLRLCDD